MKSRETLHSHESFRASEASADEAARMHDETAERMYESRATMLDSLAAHINPSLFEALARKIEHERAALVEMFSREEQVVAQKQRLDKVLRTEYFVYRKLDTNLL